MNQTKNYNSIINQKIKGEFVQREVLTCFSYEMDAILKLSYQFIAGKSELPTWDDVDNLTYHDQCPHCGGDCIVDDEKSEDDFWCEECKEVISANDVLDGDNEILEWWIVSSHLYEKLKEQGEPVLEWGNNYYWGRCTSGQAILLDHVISVICEEMEILDGQKYSWAEVAK